MLLGGFRFLGDGATTPVALDLVLDSGPCTHLVGEDFHLAAGTELPKPDGIDLQNRDPTVCDDSEVLHDIRELGPPAAAGAVRAGVSDHPSKCSLAIFEARANPAAPGHDAPPAVSRVFP